MKRCSWKQGYQLQPGLHCSAICVLKGSSACLLHRMVLLWLVVLLGPKHERRCCRRSDMMIWRVVQTFNVADPAWHLSDKLEALRVQAAAKC